MSKDIISLLALKKCSYNSSHNQGSESRLTQVKFYPEKKNSSSMLNNCVHILSFPNRDDCIFLINEYILGKT